MYLNFYSKYILKPFNLKKINYNLAATCPPSKPKPKKCGDDGGQEFKRPVRLPPGIVRCGFIPDEWMTFFFPKTGVTGLGTLFFTFGTYLFSKEWYVTEHEYYNGLSLLLLCVIAVKKLGPVLAKSLDNEIDEYEQELKTYRKEELEALEKTLKWENAMQESNEAHIMLVCAKYENVDLQLEEEYRRRLMTAYKEVVKCLDYQVALVEAEQRIAHKHMVAWIVDEVCKEYTGDLEKRYLECCIAKLASEVNLDDDK